MTLKGFNKKYWVFLSSIYLLFKIDGWKTEAKFHVIVVGISYNALLGRPKIHENNVVPSWWHQCLKFIINSLEYCIKEDLKPFDVHEVELYKDGAYFFFPFN